MSKRNKQVFGDPDSKAIIDNIGEYPFILTATWKNGKLHVLVEVIGDGGPSWPTKELEVDLIKKEPEEEECEEH